MGLAGLENKCIARLNLRASGLVPRHAVASDYVIEFPLHAVRVKWIRGHSRRDTNELDVERMSLHEIGGLRFPTEGFGNFLAGSSELAFWRGPGLLFQIVSIDFVHIQNVRDVWMGL